MATINQSPASQSSVSLSAITVNALAASGTPLRSRRNTVGSPSAAASFGSGSGSGSGAGPVVPTSGQIWPTGLPGLVLPEPQPPVDPPSAATDPDFASVSLLLHMDGANGSTTFTDSSSNARSVTAEGGAQISTAQAKHGTSSMLLDGAGDYISAVISAIGTGPYTIEGYFYAPATDVSWQPLVSLDDGLNVYFHQGAVAGYGGGLPGSDLRSKQGQSGALPSLAANTWHHWAITRTSDGTVNVFANGVAGGLTTTGLPVTANTYNSTGTSIRIGFSSFSEFFNGHIDEVRLTKGVARYTAGFTPPTAAFPDS